MRNSLTKHWHTKRSYQHWNHQSIFQRESSSVFVHLNIQKIVLIDVHCTIISRVESATESHKFQLNFPILRCSFYYSHTKKMDAAIAISDFSAEGFSMSDSLVNLSLDHILATMTAIGNFHGASYAMKHNDPARFDALRSQLVNTRAKNKGQLQATLRETSRRASNQIRKNVNDSDMVTESFLSDFERLFGENAFCFLDAKLKAKEPLAVICHGDFLRNNIAYRYDERGLATEAMLFDLQTMCYGSPMLDVCTFMAMSTGYKVRQNHFDEIFQAYYNAVIDQYLRKTNLKDVPDHMR